MIVRFTREPDDTGKVIGEEWHMDLVWLEKPPGITMLYGEVVPPVGGDTCFSSLERAYDSLSPRMVALLEALTGIHSGRGCSRSMHRRRGWASVETPRPSKPSKWSTLSSACIR